MKRFAPAISPTFIFRPFLFLLFGLGVGYWIGYTDAWRGDGTLGARVAELKDRIHPDAVSAQRKQNAEKIRQSVIKQAGIDSLLPP